MREQITPAIKLVPVAKNRLLNLTTPKTPEEFFHDRNLIYRFRDTKNTRIAWLRRGETLDAAKIVDALDDANEVELSLSRESRRGNPLLAAMREAIGIVESPTGVTYLSFLWKANRFLPSARSWRRNGFSFTIIF